MDAFQGIQLRLERAHTQCVEIHDHIAEVITANKSNITGHFDRQSGKYVFHAKKIKQPDLEVAISIGDVLHNLRSTLDNLVWQLALLNTAKPYWRGAFPILQLARKQSSSDKRAAFYSRDRGCGLDYLKSLSRRHIDMIERFQPYKRGNGGRRDPLWLLSEMNNWDKHRVVQIGTSVVKMDEISGHNGEIGQVKLFRKALHDGAKLAEVTPAK